MELQIGNNVKLVKPLIVNNNLSFIGSNTTNNLN